MKLNFENCDRIAQATAFTVRLHAGQPSFLESLQHVLEAGSIAQTLTDDEEIIAAAILHDVPELFPQHRDMVRDRFGERIARLCLPEEPLPNVSFEDNWQRCKLYAVNRLCVSAKDVKQVALSDKLAHLRAYDRAPGRIGMEGQNVSMLNWYYRSVLSVMPELSRSAAYIEAYSLIEKMLKG